MCENARMTLMRAASTTPQRYAERLARALGISLHAPPANYRETVQRFFPDLAAVGIIIELRERHFEHDNQVVGFLAEQLVLGPAIEQDSPSYRRAWACIERSRPAGAPPLGPFDLPARRAFVRYVVAETSCDLTEALLCARAVQMA